ncbi:MAG TPA: VWA domain-containing protein [Candidatus Solibacter sp.]|nr:VWA domain-containing protein [Candidatus Solibacter sp.]
MSSPILTNSNPNPAASPATAPADNAPGQEPGAQPSITQDGPIQDSGQDQGRFVFRKEVEEVVLHATVVDETGRLVTSLDKAAFSIYQNGKPEPITSFRREDVPVAMGIVIDNSGSMRDKREKVNQAVMDLIRAGNPNDEIFVVNFSQTPYLDQDFTSDSNLLQAALHQVAMRGSTALYDAVVASSVHLQHNPRLDKKVLLVITDGQDNMSRETLQEAMHRLQPGKGGVTVYAIGLTDQGFTRAGHDALQNLASATGGVAFFPESLSDVNSIASTVARDIRSQYILAYKPGNPGNVYQNIRVEARAPGQGRLTVRTRTGYYPGETVR